MKKAIRRLVALATLFTAVSTQALSIVEADAFTAGDHKAVKDTVSGLTWLDFDVTNNKSYNQVVSELNSTYAGWRLPTEGEVKTLWDNLFSQTPGWDADCYGAGFGCVFTDDNSFKAIIDLLGSGIVIDDIDASMKAETSSGFVKAADGTFRIAFLSHVVFDTHTGEQASQADFYDPEFDTWDPDGWYGQFGTGWADATGTNSSTFLVKKVNAPEPSSLLMFSIGLLGLGFSRRVTRM